MAMSKLFYISYRTCFVVLPVDMPACTQTSLDTTGVLNVTGLDLSSFDLGRRKRSVIDETPLSEFMEFPIENEDEAAIISKDGELYNFFDYISKVREDYPKPETSDSEDDMKVQPTRVSNCFEISINRPV